MKKLIKSIVHYFGFDLHRLSPSQLLASLNHVGVNTVFDIGANTGQFAQDLRTIGFAGRIISFDPLTAAHSQLMEAAHLDAAWLVHPRVALGAEDGEIEINIAGNSVSSSVLPMLDAHSSAAVGSSYVAVERTPLVRLDSVAPQYLNSDSRLFIKIDTQGYEWQVLDGAAQTLKGAQGVMLEMSLVSLYEGERLWRDLIDRMALAGFTLWAIQKGFTDPRTGRSLQVDAIFLRVS